jgi:hypothetical protein
VVAEAWFGICQGGEELDAWLTERNAAWSKAVSNRLQSLFAQSTSFLAVTNSRTSSFDIAG